MAFWLPFVAFSRHFPDIFTCAPNRDALSVNCADVCCFCGHNEINLSHVSHCPPPPAPCPLALAPCLNAVVKRNKCWLTGYLHWKLNNAWNLFTNLNLILAASHSSQSVESVTRSQPAGGRVLFFVLTLTLIKWQTRVVAAPKFGSVTQRPSSFTGNWILIGFGLRARTELDLDLDWVHLPRWGIFSADSQVSICIFVVALRCVAQLYFKVLLFFGGPLAFVQFARNSIYLHSSRNDFSASVSSCSAAIFGHWSIEVRCG